MDADLRCANNILHGRLVDGMLEVKCRSHRCGFRRGSTVVLHRFDVETGNLVQTLRFKETPVTGRSKAHDDARTASIRSA